MPSLLAHFSLAPDGVAVLPRELQRRVVDFLVRWEAYGEALQCLDAQPPDAQPLNVIQRAQALHGLGRSAAAIDLLLAQPNPPEPRLVQEQLVRLYLATARYAPALAVAQALWTKDGTLGAGWSLLNDVYLAQGQLELAQDLCLRQQRAAPASRLPLLGLLRVHLQRGDLVTAAAYGVRVMAQAERAAPLSVPELVELRTLFEEAGDPNRVDALNRQLQDRFQREEQELQSLLRDAPKKPSKLADGAAKARTAAPQPAVASPAVATSARGTPPQVAPIQSVAVTARERAEFARAAREFFGYDALLPGQAEIIACVQRGEHVLAVLPTGAGKSLCYQLPAFLGEGVTLVVSPLIALMKDQLDGLPEGLRGQAVAINSSLDGDNLRRVIDRMAQGSYRLVYIAPERLRQLPFVAALKRAGLARLVIDEAHCVSIWGHDFRPDYLHLAQAHQDLGRPPLLAMTATAPPRVRQDIERQLFGTVGAMRVLVGDTFRPNLQLTVLRVRDDDERLHRLVAIVQQLPGPAIIYARSRQRCEEVATLLRTQGINAAHYHAGIADREAVQDRFRRNELAAIVATVAFGMGVDKRDIRLVVHYELPNSVEGYYQEIGRAGRDGERSHCVLLYGDRDQATLSHLASQGQISRTVAQHVYGALKRLLAGRETGAVVWADLAAATGGDETLVRTVLALLEQAGLVRRHYDAPRTVSFQQLPGRRGWQPPAGYQRLLAAAGLEQEAAAAVDFVTLANAAGLTTEALEAQLLAWHNEGWLRYFPGGRTAVLTLLPAPPDLEARLERLLSQRHAVTFQRIQEIADYAATTKCRHSYLANYLGGSPRTRCGVCDRCGASLPVQANPKADPFAGHARVVLAALDEQRWGRRTLVRLLRGDSAAGDRARQSRYYGKLREREEQSLGQLIDSLQAEGFISPRELDHGGTMLELTAKGRKQL